MKTKFIKLTFILLLIASFKISFSQENYLQGYVINLNGDTIHGLINYLVWENNPDVIWFKKNIDSKKVSYIPKDILEFSVADENYISATVKAATSSLNVNNLSTYGDLTEAENLGIEIDTIFLETLVNGKKSLYYYKNWQDRDNFYIKVGDSLKLLKYNKYLKLAFNGNEEGKKFVMENKKYVGQLKVYLQDCPSIQSKINSISYSKLQLVNVFNDYYNCINQKPTFQKKVAKAKLEFGALAGISNTSLYFYGIGNAQSTLTTLQFNNSVNVAGGIFLNIVMPRNFNKWSFYNELLYTNFNLYSYHEDITSADYYTKDSITLAMSYIKLFTMVRFKYPVGPLYIFLNIGISNGVAVLDKSHVIRRTKFYSDEKRTETRLFDAPRKYELGQEIGIGIRFNKFSGELRFERGNGMSPLIHILSHTSRYYLLLGYRF